MVPKFIDIILVLLFAFLCNYDGFEATILSDVEDFELERELESLNKPPVKTFKFNEDKVVDCIAIDKQPALDHPLLKNHKIQMIPQLDLTEITKNLSMENLLPLKNSQRQICPIGTVPILRTTKEDLAKAKNFSNMFSSNAKNYHQVSVVLDKGELYHGADALISTHDITSVKPDQVSSTNIWIEGGPPISTHGDPDPRGDNNIITAGWTVSPQLYGDTRSRLYSYWTPDGYKSGCFNTLCKGFIQIDREFYNGYPVQTSVPKDLRGYFFMINQDIITRNWWFIIIAKDISSGHLNMIRVGYWPKELFTYLQRGASRVAWGASAFAGRDGMSPPMGLGHLPFGDYKVDSQFVHIHYINSGNFTRTPSSPYKYIDKSGCYDLKTRTHQGEYSFIYGGRGGLCG